MELQTIVFMVGLGFGAVLLLSLIFGVLLLLLGVVVSLVFFKTRKIIIPNITLPILNLLESPIRFLLWKVGVEEDIVSNLIIDLRNIRYKDQYIKTPYTERMVFLPQCLRHPKCPAPLTEEGIKCLNCGRCGIGILKEETEQLGGRFFIAPGSSLIKRMIKKYHPKAVLGIGCSMEVKEGTAVISSIGLPVQGVKLLRDGCVDTRVDMIKLYELIKTPPKQRYNIHDHLSDLKRAMEIASLWSDTSDTRSKILKHNK
ncbi:MAG: DUF116 domain-containing protein [Candidatus Altiarchaeota archaeon]|nr:DUF116 domain-containing protein [Candidatus Altiarchaeota archaeon]